MIIFKFGRFGIQISDAFAIAVLLWVFVAIAPAIKWGLL